MKSEAKKPEAPKSQPRADGCPCGDACPCNPCMCGTSCRCAQPAEAKK